VYQAKRLLQEESPRFEHAFAVNRSLCISGHIEYFHRRPDDGHALGQLTAIHARHNNVGDHQRNFSGVFAGDAQSVLAVAGFEHRVAVHSQIVAHESADAFFIFHHQQRL